ncbi:DinB family protein [Christiangramia sabulilitoris]|uniref:DinB family protein n=1 Tax=Christiangramia sabulilitoris TaxID=2583991 RepID=A0A550I6H4_9FLAO|nr:DinB family protein [Christiangramia sabulilitoris]TRO66572.1 DinB family protein [Christiangramia sabulilitoris]
MKKSQLTHGEFGEFYSGYINRIDADAELINSLEKNTEVMLEFFKGIPSEKWNYRYEPEKWTILDMVQHIIDTERIFQFRALCFARNEQKSLPGFDHDLYVLNSASENRSVPDLIEEFDTVRRSGLYLYKSFSEDMLKMTGSMNDVNASPRAIGFIMIGHALHHKEIISNRYL